ncbi:MAG: quinolinate synthase NadA [Candidatus Omnitrophica bacterium]|nr:quinolinate synthase NadA [Candidatus Omnitrophota bacterium]
MSEKRILEEIESLKKERNAVILAHNYQIGEVQDIADYVGDSLELSRRAAQTDAEVIVFCGVLFMAETASILSPQKTVLLPEINAGCPMADMITASELRALKKKNPGSEVICYVNSSAEVKAESDICCTSANATEIVNSLKGDRPPIFVPDMNLGRYASKMTGREMIFWKGHCYVHTLIRAEDLKKQKEKHPKAVVIVHPECLPDVIELADEVASTSGMLRFAARCSVDEMIIGTETGLLHKLKKDNPKKKFWPASEHAICDNMKKTTLGKVLNALRELKYVVKVPPEIRVKAERAVEKMIACGGTPTKACPCLGEG